MVAPELLDALKTNLALLREVGLRYDVATDTRRGCDSYENTMQTPEDVAAWCADMLPMVQEQLRVLLLNTKQAVVDMVTVYQGTVNSADVRVAEVLRPAILANVPNMIVVHNHPSGDSTPSSSDIAITNKLRRAADLMGITLHDHVIIAAGATPFSMARRGLAGFGEGVAPLG